MSKLGVELILAQEEDMLQGVCFVLPDRYNNEGVTDNFAWLFNLVVTKEAKNLAALMLFRIMNWYPAIMCIGVTDGAAKLYNAMRWKKYEGIWRCVHPIKLSAMVKRYKERLKNPYKILVLKAVGLIYDTVMLFLESITLLASNIKMAKFIRSSDLNLRKPPLNYGSKLKIISTYRDIYVLFWRNRIIKVVDWNGIGRVVQDDFDGLIKFIAHLKLWQKLREENIILSEYIATSKKSKIKAMLCGYIPIKMPIYFWDKNIKLNNFIKNIEQSNFNFASCDKII